MKALIEQIAEKLAKKYSLDKDALLGQSKDLMYIDLGSCLVELDKHTHLSKCISTESKMISAVNAVQSLLQCCYGN